MIPHVGSDMILLLALYLVSQASDHTGQSWLTCFGEAGETLFNGLKAPELKRLEIDEPKLYDKVPRSFCFYEGSTSTSEVINMKGCSFLVFFFALPSSPPFLSTARRPT